MSIQVFTLEQVCKESAAWQALRASSVWSGSLNDPFNRNSSLPRVWKLHEVLRHLTTTLTLPLPFDEWLRSLTTLTMQAMKVDLCVVMLTDQTRNHLRTSTCIPDLTEKGVVMQPVNVEPALWERLRTFMLRGQLPSLAVHELAALNPLKNVQYETLIPIPLIVGSEYMGLICCYASQVPYYSEDDQLMVSTIANQAALAIKYRQCIDEEALAQKALIKAFVNDLFSGNAEQEELLRRRAHVLGYDLSQPHVVALMEWSEVEKPAHADSLVVSRQERQMLCDGVVGQLQQFLQELYPGSLVDERDNLLVCLLRPCNDFVYCRTVTEQIT